MKREDLEILKARAKEISTEDFVFTVEERKEYYILNMNGHYISSGNYYVIMSSIMTSLSVIGAVLATRTDKIIKEL